MSKEQPDFTINNLSLPNPKNTTIFGVNLILHTPPAVFSLILKKLPPTTSVASLAALSEWIPTHQPPIQFSTLYNQSYIFVQSFHDSHQYTNEALSFLFNAFPSVAPDEIESFLNNSQLDITSTCLFLDQNYNHAQRNPNSQPIEISNPYISQLIMNLAQFDQEYQNSPQPIAVSPIQPNNQPNTINNQNNNQQLYPSSFNNQNQNNDEIIAQQLQNQFNQESFKAQQDLQNDEEFARRLQQEYDEEEKKKRQEKESKLIEKDEAYAQKLQSQLDIESQIERKRQEQQNNIFECGCCCFPFPFEEMAQCPEGHLICKECIQRSIETALGEGTIRKNCLDMESGCTAQISNSELMRILPNDLIRRLDEMEALTALTGVNIKNLRTCWKCAYKVIDDNDDGPFNCPECHELSCKLCNKKYHPGRTCEQADIDPNRIVEYQMSEAIVKHCPKCNTQYVKEEGCNHMTCPICKTYSCYLCGQPFTSVSEHFSNGKCKQMMDTKKYNAEAIENAKKKAQHDLQLDSN